MDFFVTLRTAGNVEPLADPLPFDSLEAAYLDACAAVPAAAADLLRERRNPFRCAFLISDANGVSLLEVPFTDVLHPSERDEPPRLRASRGDTAAARLQVQISRLKQLRREAAALHCRAASFAERVRAADAAISRRA